jgi:hypothetical protein
MTKEEINKEEEGLLKQKWSPERDAKIRGLRMIRILQEAHEEYDGCSRTTQSY